MIKIAATTGTALRSTDYTDFSSILPLQKFPSFALLLLPLSSPSRVNNPRGVCQPRRTGGTMTTFRKWRCVIGDDAAAKKNDGFEGSHRNETHGLV